MPRGVATRARPMRGSGGHAAGHDVAEPCLEGGEHRPAGGEIRRGDALSRAAELIASFGLSDAEGRLVKTYSGGMRRRLDLAASLMARRSLPVVALLIGAALALALRSRTSGGPMRAEEADVNANVSRLSDR